MKRKKLTPQREHQLRLIGAGLCESCAVDDHAVGSTFCEGCLSRRRELARERYARGRVVDGGRCSLCGEHGHNRRTCQKRDADGE